MRASLADQQGAQLRRRAAAVAQALQQPRTLAIALGANLPSPAGEPVDTLLTVRPLLEQVVQDWSGAPTALRFCWSPLLWTAPVGGPADQNDYVNGALLVELPSSASLAQLLAPEPIPTATAAALKLLQGLQQLESRFGRPPLAEREHWGPRSLDLDWLWWGHLQLDLPATAATPALQLPHPLWRQRGFVVEPLAAIARLRTTL
ncbi:MAG: 2-amino-4-hydroxy-6-hydroxymethyldihydropteridine diphosphokinase [Cyanobacteriota bacterium]|nr:2-amino-4-hydroxy-6-hydroxymethyldihydropteridine diphosphokinase [Cyanobacteriota bacterium]